MIELELRGRGDIQLFRVEVPGPRITRDIASDAKVRLSVPRSHFNELAREGKVRHWREAFQSGTVKATGPGGDPQADPERGGEAGGAGPHPQAARQVSFRMPAEGAAHDRTLMAWPAREDMWEEHFEAAKAVYAEVANAITAFEPVTMVAPPAKRKEARAACGDGVTVTELPIDDSWMRDNGPIFVLDGTGRRAGVDFGFNAWGEKFKPYDDDAEVTARLLERMGEERIDATDFILEGGSIAVDGEGMLVTTEQCLLHPTRNPGLSKDEIARRLQDELGVHTVVWLGQGLVEDVDTDGHVDNVCAFIAPGRVLLQTVADEANPNWEHTRENVERLQAAGLEVEELPLLPYVDHDGPPTVVPYTNFYVCNGGADRARRRPGDRRRGAGAAGRALPGPRGRRGPGRDAGPGRRRGPLHHAAGPRRRSESLRSGARGRRRGRRPASRR